ncbi:MULTISPECIES: sulfur transferase domain-containing protein [unclassified Nostoc]|uniref:beta-lactamase hydrolase domain-containing protein n=1 Tax=unclassified Nostoc TaxID=2593658 RepID=UPI0025AA72FA|nr:MULTISPECIES: sulfur transferase domain-containing protein [unclassified Nostoc]MDM9581640.1 sulfur transferase domain-containing protein [Nostoc sp. GT001]MDZ7947044.1 sulfur transferase domain-containing protein [Nostoc sp. EfeVER01]MDZ7991468.1 sulfur transferase domain-containing protein [Nostoc sp. EspVER01]
MNIVRKINDNLAIAGQITLDQLGQIADEGYKSVLNLRLPDEIDLLANEQEKTELLGLYYVNIPTKPEDINHQGMLQIYQIITELPKPILIHCDNSIRSAAIVLLYIALKQGIAFEKALQKVINLGLI